MKSLEKVGLAKDIFFALILKKRLPLVVSWALTHKCNLRCKYCGIWEMEFDELDTFSVYSLIEELALLGTKFIVFTGGEILLRNDIGKIIKKCKTKNIHITINSNGLLLKEKINQVKMADQIQLSLDGPSYVHDFIREKGAHDKVIEAIKVCKKEGVKTNIVAVISKHNIFNIDYLLKVAETYNVKVRFQPATRNLDGNRRKKNPLCPDESKYKKTIDYLIRKKYQGCKFIDNSVYGLRHIYFWPNPKKINCLLKFIHCHIFPDGRIFTCSNFLHYKDFLVPLNRKFQESFYNLSLPHDCCECWCSGMVEFNLIGKLRLNSLFSVWEKIKAL